MIKKFLKYLENNQIDFLIINGYTNIFNDSLISDKDILLKKDDFYKIDFIMKDFCQKFNYKIIQILHHDIYAKNIFIYNPKDLKILNLDLYGELSRKNIIFFSENEIFSTKKRYKNFSILSPEKEFIYYFFKKIDKNDLNLDSYEYLRKLFNESKNDIAKSLQDYFDKTYEIIVESFANRNIDLLFANRNKIISDIVNKKQNSSIHRKIKNLFRSIKRVIYPTGISIAFLGPDGSGKSTIIQKIQEIQLPFRRKDYFHLKPVQPKFQCNTVSSPHQYPLYSSSKSYIKLLYFIYQYNVGWLKNILPLKIRSSLVIFDRYYDDLLVDYKRYRYGGNKIIANIIKIVIPKPDIYFVLVTDAKVIYDRKQEVELDELKRQIKGYRELADNKRYFIIDVNSTPEEISKKIIAIILEKMNERYQ